MDKIKDLQELALGSRLKRVSDQLMKEIQLVYNKVNIDFDPYLFPVFKTIADEKKTTIKILTEKLKITQPAITQIINKLNSKGYIDVEIDIIDKRKKNIKLSIDGKLILKELLPLWKIIDETIKEKTSSINKFINQINELEGLLTNNTLSKLILYNYQNHINSIIKIESYKAEYAKYFKDYNIEWLEKYFVVEPHDSLLLEDCENNIIKKGGYIFISSINNNIVGCYSFIKINDKTYELGKMAVTEKYQGLKIGNAMLKHSIQLAKDNNWNKIILYSNKKLENAIHLYKKFGFIEIPLEKNLPYLRSNIKMELKFN